MVLKPISLNLAVDLVGRQFLLSSGQQICLVRAFEGADYFVCGAVIDPFGDQTAVSYLPDWQLYVMQGQLTTGMIVQLQSRQPSAAGELFTFTGNQFTGPSPCYSSTVFGLNNQFRGGPLCWGLAQSLVLNNTAILLPQGIASAYYNEASYCTPSDLILAFIGKGLEQGAAYPMSLLQPAAFARKAVLTVGPCLSVPFTDDTTIYFNTITHCFQLNPLS
jgi:hypothetical protein